MRRLLLQQRIFVVKYGLIVTERIAAPSKSFSKNQAFTQSFSLGNSRNRYFSTESGSKPDAAAAAAVTPEVVTEGSGVGEKVVVVDVQAEQITKLQKDLKDMKDQLLRSYAEEENVRRIAKKDIENAKEYSNNKFASAMLDVADNLERAMSTVPANKRDGSSTVDPSFKVLVDGLELTEKELQKTFVSFGVVKFGAIGDAFDPAFHEALFQIPDPKREAGKIGQVLKSGYKLKGRVLRAAQVGTVIKPATD